MAQKTLKEAWLRQHRDQWYKVGFDAARKLAVNMTLEAAEELDYRTEEARLAKLRAPRATRALRRVANALGAMTKPPRPLWQDVEGVDDE